MNKISIIPILFLLLISFSSAFTLEGDIDLQPMNRQDVSIGIYAGDDLTIQQYETLTDTEFEHQLLFANIKSVDYSQVTDSLDAGYMPILTLEFTDGDLPYGNQLNITAGYYDSYIEALANEIEADGRPIQLRPMHEFNGNWYQWGVFYDNRTPQAGENNITNMKDAWIHIHDTITAITDLVDFQFNYNRYSGYEDETPFEDFYVGDAYVDVVGITEYNRAYLTEYHQEWESFDDGFFDVYNEITGFTNKSIVISEIGTTSYTELGGGEGGLKPEWILDAFQRIRDSYPSVVQVSWFLNNVNNADGRVGIDPAVRDWNLNSPEDITAFKEGFDYLSDTWQTNSTFSHYGTTESLEELSVNQKDISFNVFDYNTITLNAQNHGDDKIYFNYDGVNKKLYINITHSGGVVDITNANTVRSSSDGLFYEVLKNGVLFDDELTDADYTLTGIGNYTLRADVVLSTLGSYINDYDNTSFETERQSWRVLVPLSIAEQFYNVILKDEYDNEYETTYEDLTYSDYRIYTSEFNIPTEPTTDTNVTFYWVFSKFGGGSIQSDHFNTSVKTIDINTNYPACDSLPYYNGFVGKIFDEDNPTSELFIDGVRMEMDYWFDSLFSVAGGQTYITENYEKDPYSTEGYVFCTKDGISYYNYNVYAQIDVPAPQTIDPLSPPLVTTTQTCDSTTNTTDCTSNSTSTYTYVDEYFTQRWYGLGISGYDVNGLLGRYYTMYAINDSTGYTALEITLVDSYSGSKLQNKYVYMQRYYLDEGAWRVVQTGKTDANGKALFYIKEESTDYRFNFYDEEGNLYETTPSMAFYCNTNLCTRTFYVDTLSYVSTDRPTVNIDATYINTTGILQINWYSVEGTGTTVDAKITKSGTSTRTICEETDTGASGRIYCDVSAYSGEINIYVSSTYGGSTKTEYTDTFVIADGKIGSKLNLSDAVFWVFLIILIIATTFTRSPVGLVLASLVGFIFMVIMGFLTGITIGMITGIVVIGIIIILKVKSNNG